MTHWRIGAPGEAKRHCIRDACSGEYSQEFPFGWIEDARRGGCRGSGIHVPPHDWWASRGASFGCGEFIFCVEPWTIDGQSTNQKHLDPAVECLTTPKPDAGACVRSTLLEILAPSLREVLLI